jgi:hypothetical protein
MNVTLKNRTAPERTYPLTHKDIKDREGVFAIESLPSLRVVVFSPKVMLTNRLRYLTI